jgi:hypothetical protein
LFEAPDLILTLPFAPDGHGGAWVGIAMVGEIDVEVGAMDKDAGEKDPST